MPIAKDLSLLPSRDMAGFEWHDVVDYIDRTTYEIWNDRRPDLVQRFYTPHTVVWTDAGVLVGQHGVTRETQDRQAAYSGYVGAIDDTIWTGDDRSGYRTSMRWTWRGTTTGAGPLRPPPGRAVTGSTIANCLVVGERIVEEWKAGDPAFAAQQMGIEPATALERLAEDDAGYDSADRRTGEQLGATVPAIPPDPAESELFVTELFHALYNARDLAAADRCYAPGAPYTYGRSRVSAGPLGVRAEVSRWLDLLPDLRLVVEELYSNQDDVARSRVAVRYRITGTARTAAGERSVSTMGVHHLHVRGDLIVAEWAEYDSLALRAQLAGG